MSETSDQLYPIVWVKHFDRYQSKLYDVDGYLLVGEEGEPLNVYKEELKDMMINRKIRFVHYLATEPTYCYFVTSQEQVDRFQKDRDGGSKTFDKHYHIYPDER